MNGDDSLAAAVDRYAETAPADAVRDAITSRLADDPAAAALLELDAADADPVLLPEEHGEGHWVGAPATHTYAGTEYVAVRHRDPERRGHRIDLYADAVDGDPVTSLAADDLDAVSVERAAFATTPLGELRVYVPLERGENDWTIAALDPVAEPQDLDPATAVDVLGQGAATDRETVKDPVVWDAGDRYGMDYAGHDGTSEQAHLATSLDGRHWVRALENPVLGRAGWHDHHTRVSARVPLAEQDGHLLAYDGSGTGDYGKTWNLRTGLAYSPVPGTAVDLTPEAPLLSAAEDDDGGLEGFGTCRYLAPADNGFYVEMARGDGSFGLYRLDG